MRTSSSGAAAADRSQRQYALPPDWVELNTPTCGDPVRNRIGRCDPLAAKRRVYELRENGDPHHCRAFDQGSRGRVIGGPDTMSACSYSATEPSRALDC